MKHIFLVEDDMAIAKNLSRLLTAEGFTVTHAPTMQQAFDMLGKQRFDLGLVDISLPDGNGFTVCTEIKEVQDIPVIFLTASGDEASVVTGLNMGGDDYVTKPFRPRELVARIRTALRRSAPASSVFEAGGLSVDTAAGIVKKDGINMEKKGLINEKSKKWKNVRFFDKTENRWHNRVRNRGN